MLENALAHVSSRLLLISLFLLLFPMFPTPYCLTQTSRFTVLSFLLILHRLRLSIPVPIKALSIGA